MADTQNMPFIKHLASSDRKIRTSALDTLRTFLSASASSSRLTPTDNLKLWKGLFFSMWMCDRPIPQQNLASDLASLLDTIASSARRAPGGEESEVEVVIGWLAAFWETMSREWTSIDVLRLEKFLLLVRRVFGSSLAWAGAGKSVDDGDDDDDQGTTTMTKTQAKTNRKARRLGKTEENGGEEREHGRGVARKKQDALLALFRAWPLEETGDLGKVPVGLRLHVLDIWVDECEKVGIVSSPGEEEEEEEKKKKEQKGEEEQVSYFLSQMREVVDVQVTSPHSKPVRMRAKESLGDERLPWNEKTGGEGDDGDEDMNEGGGNEDEDGWGGFDD